MDRLLYVAMSGASETMQAQAIKANNLANSTTTGFRAHFQQQRAMPVYGYGLPTRVYAASELPGYDFKFAAAQYTGNALHAAVQGEGWFAVQGKDGQEGYTRRGDFQVNQQGFLVNGANDLVLGEGGPIVVPPAQSIMISDSGAISIVPLGVGDVTVQAAVGQLKLVKPDESQLYQREDGLFLQKDGLIAPADPAIRVTAGALEASNVNAVGELIELISLARKHELDVKIMKNAEDNDKSSSKLLSIG